MYSYLAEDRKKYIVQYIYHWKTHNYVLSLGYMGGECYAQMYSRSLLSVVLPWIPPLINTRKFGLSLLPQGTYPGECLGSKNDSICAMPDASSSHIYS